MELNGLRRAYNALVKHINKIYRLRVPYNMLEGVPCQPLSHVYLLQLTYINSHARLQASCSSTCGQRLGT